MRFFCKKYPAFAKEILEMQLEPGLDGSKIKEELNGYPRRPLGQFTIKSLIQPLLTRSNRVFLPDFNRTTSLNEGKKSLCKKRV